jgi:archaellum component FlaC
LQTALREVQNGMRKDANRFSAENNRLEVAIQGMNVELEVLKQKEQRLQELTKEQDTITVQSLVGSVEESKQVTEQMKEVV